MKILVTGSGGQVGRELVAAFADQDLTALDRQRLDVADREAVLAAITSLRPDAVVHAAAWTDVDGCEGDEARALRVNGLGTRHVAEAARRVDAHMCALSTDYVFDGTKSDPYVEWDTPNPCSAYGRSKLAGELELRGDAGATVVRTSWVCGGHGHNMVKTILRLAESHDTLRFVDDQRGHPTFARDLAGAVQRLVVERRPGCFHVTNQGAVTWFEFARAVLEASGHDPARVEPIKTADLDPPRPAPRPANSVLDNAALRLSGLPLLRDFHEPLQELVQELRR
ncbi:MAG TPA: dTDP-4-dehydrorhamnose reductase [Acidimicrobiia bacterium]